MFEIPFSRRSLSGAVRIAVVNSMPVMPSSVIPAPGASLPEITLTLPTGQGLLIKP